MDKLAASKGLASKYVPGSETNRGGSGNISGGGGAGRNGGASRSNWRPNQYPGVPPDMLD